MGHETHNGTLKLLRFILLQGALLACTRLILHFCSCTLLFPAYTFYIFKMIISAAIIFLKQNAEELHACNQEDAGSNPALVNCFFAQPQISLNLHSGLLLDIKRGKKENKNKIDCLILPLMSADREFRKWLVGPVRLGDPILWFYCQQENIKWNEHINSFTIPKVCCPLV